MNEFGYNYCDYMPEECDIFYGQEEAYNPEYVTEPEPNETEIQEAIDIEDDPASPLYVPEPETVSSSYEPEPSYHEPEPESVRSSYEDSSSSYDSFP